MWRDLQTFLRLYDRSSRLALFVAMSFACVLAVAEFAILLAIYPVFGSLVNGGGGASHLLPSFLPAMKPSNLIALAIALLIFRSVGDFASKAWWSGRAGKAEVLLSQRLLRSYAYAPYAFHLRSNSGDLLSRAIAQVNMVSTSGLNGLASLATDSTVLLAIALALLVANFQVAVVILIIIGVLGAVFVGLSRGVIRDLADRYAVHVGAVYKRATGFLRGIRELTVANSRATALESIDDARSEMVRAQQRLIVLGEVPRMTLELVIYFGMLGTLMLVLRSGEITQWLPVIALFTFAGMRLLPAIGRCLRTFTEVRTALELSKQLHDELGEIERQGGQPQQPAGDLPHRAALSLTRIDFSYDDGPDVLKDVSITVPFGSTVGIVGPSGSGKSTLLGIMLGLLSPSHGYITYGGQTIGTADATWLSRIAFVPQDVFVMDDTVLNNVALGHDHPSREKATWALQEAHLWESVADEPGGLDRQLGEGGVRMSAGQRQRLGIARALYRDAEVVLLDEPTAALDSETEEKIVATLDALKQRATVIIVSHRRAPLDTADFIYAIDRGRLVPERLGTEAHLDASTGRPH